VVGRRALTLGEDRAVRAWDLDAGSPVTELARPGAMWSLDRSATRVVAGGDDGSVRVWDANTLQEVHAFRGGDQPVLQARIDPAERQVLALSADGAIRVWDLASGELRATLPGEAKDAADATFAGDGTAVFALTNHHAIVRWTISQAPAGRLDHHAQGTL